MLPAQEYLSLADGGRGMLLAQTLGPKEFAGCCRNAVRHSAIGDHQKIIALKDRRGHIGGATGGAPGDVGLRHIPSAVQANGEDVVVREPTRDKLQPALLAVNGRRDELLGWAVDLHRGASKSKFLLSCVSSKPASLNATDGLPSFPCVNLQQLVFALVAA